MEENNDINKLSASDVQKLKMNPPDHAWSRLDAELARKRELVNREKANRYKALFIITGLLLLCTVGYLYFASSSSKNAVTIVSQKEEYKEQPASVSTGTALLSANGNKASRVQDKDNTIPNTVATSPSLTQKENKKEALAKPQAIAKNAPDSSDRQLSQKQAIASNSTNHTAAFNNNAVSNGKTVKHSPIAIAKKSADKENNTATANSPFKNTEALVSIENTKNNTAENSAEMTPAVSATNEEKPLANEQPAKVPDLQQPADVAAGPANISPTKIQDSAKAVSEPANETETMANNSLANPVNTNTLPQIETKNLTSRLSITAFFSPDYSVNHLTKNGQTNVPVSIYESNEKIKFSHSTGLLLGFDLTKHWKVSLGGVYSTIAYSVSLPAIYAYNNSNNELHYMYPTACGIVEMPNSDEYVASYKGESLNTTASCSQVVRFINIPLSVGYQVNIKKFSLYLNAGVEANFVMQERANVSINNTETTVINNIDGLKKMNYGFISGLRIQYNVRNSMGIFIEPSFRTAINSLTQNIPVNCYPYSYGLNTGVSFHF